jgi:hypothetical protein
VRTRDAMRRCFRIEPRQVGIGDIELDFGHSVVPIEAEHRQKAAS